MAHSIVTSVDDCRVDSYTATCRLSPLQGLMAR